MKVLILRPLRPRRRPDARRAAATAGFTLLEVLVVLIILGLVAAIFAGPQVFQFLGTAKSESAEIQVERIGSALDLYRLHTGRYPTTEQGLEALVRPPGDEPAWNGPYLKNEEAITDPWRRTFRYRAPGEHGDYDLYTYGSDDAAVGEGEARDITSW